MKKSEKSSEAGSWKLWKPEVDTYDAGSWKRSWMEIG